MSLAPGSRLGPYEILALIGAGGMGEVYRARDTRLDRIVAIKISAAEFNERFEREARAVAALNHPHICTLYDVGPDYLVMEYVDGPTLADRIAAGPIQMEEALPLVRQIAEALEAAHEKGIVHRDLKPANVKLTSAGQVKVLDFGLAKAFDPETIGDPRSSPTLTLSFTRAGLILGTAAYMSPEQARGIRIDKRTDIWSFGVVLCEMLTGRQLFQGETVSDTLAAVLRADFDVSTLPSATAPAIRRLLRRCLERDPKKRLPDISVVRLEIDDALSGQREDPSPPSPQPLPAKSRLSYAVAGSLAIVAATALAGWWRAGRPVERLPQSVIRLDVDLGSDVSLGPTFGADAILSPDGSRLVYVSRSRLFTRRLDQPSAIELAGTEGANAPFFSPDGQWVAFFATAGLKKASVSGGAGVTLSNHSGWGGSWGQDGNIVAALGNVLHAFLRMGVRLRH
jgi:serine/threonine-protein kinase